MTVAVCAASLASIALPVSRALVWNATASLPTGLYHIRGSASLHVGERIAIDPPPRWRAFLARRGYLPAGVPLLKEVAALPGDRVCRAGRAITINARRAASARERDSHGRLLPDWQGCRTLARGEIFALNRRAPDSFDGRYLGPLRVETVIGRASPVWTDESGDGTRVWFARPALKPDRNANLAQDR